MTAGLALTLIAICGVVLLVLAILAYIDDVVGERLVDWWDEL